MGSGRVGEGEGVGRAERTAVEEVRLEVFAGQHEKPLGLRPCRRDEGGSGARFSYRRSGPAGQGSADAGERASSDSSRSKKALRVIYLFKRWRLFARGCVWAKWKMFAPEM